MPSPIGGAFKGLGSGLRTIMDVLQTNAQEKRIGEELAREIADKKHAREMDAFMRSNVLNDQGGYVEDAPVQGAPFFQARLGPVGQPTQRPVTMQDLLDGQAMSRVRVDPMRSTAAKLQREKDERQRLEREAVAGLFTDPEEQGAARAGESPSQIRASRPPAMPRPGNLDPLSPEGIAQRVALERQLAGIPTRQGQGTSQGKTLPAAQIEKLAMFTDLEAAARSIPALIDQEKGDIGTGPLIGKVPRFVRDFASGSQGKVNARAVISSIAGQYMNLISGAAVSPSEAARLAPFVPDGRDDEQTIRNKAVAFANRLRQIQAAKKQAFRAAGYRLDDDGTEENPPEDAFEDGQVPQGNRFQSLIPRK